MRGASGEVLYVGKASSLRSRLRSYFSSPSGLAPKIRTMVGKVADFDFIVTESDQEALILEYNLIKQHKPTYNARLKDDKSYPFIKIDMSEEFPLVYITRTVTRDGSRYFGPFASAYSVRRTLSLLKKLFPYRSCTKTITGNDSRPCLDYYIHRCVAPCIGNVDTQQYQEVIDQVVLFLEGKADRVVKSIQARMERAAESLEFEQAAVLRDQLRAIESVHEGQKVLHLTSENLDVIAAASGRREAWVEVFFVRRGTLIGRDHFIMEGTQDDEPQRILTAFVKQFYGGAPYVPPRILVQHPPEDAEALREWLAEKRQGPVRFHVPQRGEKRKLVEMVAENAAEGLVQLEVKAASDAANLDTAMTELEEALSLPKPPQRIECYDISNIQGSNPVGSMVVFEDGKPKPSHYRRFKVETVEGVDDYSMMREVLTRRFRRLGRSRDGRESDGQDGGEARSGRKQTWAIVPDLVLIDGGQGTPGSRAAGVPGAGDRLRAAGQPRQGERGAVRAPRAGGHRAAPHLPGAVPGAAGAGRGAPVRRHLPPPAAVQAHHRVGPRPGSGHRAEAPADAAAALRIGEGHQGGAPSGRRRGPWHDHEGRQEGQGTAVALPLADSGMEELWQLQNVTGRSAPSFWSRLRLSFGMATCSKRRRRRGVRLRTT